MFRLENIEDQGELNRQTALAQERYRRALRTPGASQSEIANAQLGLDRIRQFQTGEQGASSALRQGFFSRTLFSGLSYISQPLGFVNSLLELPANAIRGENEGFGGFVEGITGIDTTDNGFFGNALTLLQAPLPIVFDENGIAQRDITLQTSFGDVTGDWAGDNPYLQVLQGGTNFVFDVALDPTTYLFGVGLLKGGARGAVVRGATSNSARNAALDARVLTQAEEIITRGANRTTIAANLVDTAFVGNVPRAHMDALEEFAATAAYQGAHTARHGLKPTQRAIVDNYVSFNLGLSTPWYARKFVGDKVFLLPGTDNAVTNFARRRSESLGTRFFNFRDGKGVGGNTEGAFREAGRKGPEVFKRHVTLSNVVQQSSQMGRELNSMLESAWVSVVPGVRPDKNGKIAKDSLSNYQKYRSPEVAAGISRSLADGFTDSAAEFSLELADGSEITDGFEVFGNAFDAIADEARRRDLPAISFEEFRSSYANLSDYGDAVDAYRTGAMDLDEKTEFLATFDPKRGDIIGMIDGVPIILDKGTDEALEMALLSLSKADNATFDIGDDALVFLENYGAGIAKTRSDDFLARELHRHGLGVHKGSIKPIPLVEMLDNIGRFDEFRVPGYEDILAKISPGAAAAKRARDFDALDVNKRIEALRSDLARLRSTKVEPSIERLKSKVGESGTVVNTRATENRRRSKFIRSIDKQHAYRAKIAQAQQELAEMTPVEIVAEGSENGIGTLAEVTRLKSALRKEIDDTQFKLDRELEKYRLLRDAGNLNNELFENLVDFEEIDAYQQAQEELAQLLAKSPSTVRHNHRAFIQRVFQDIFESSTKVVDSKGRKVDLTVFGDRRAIAQGESLQADLVEAINSTEAKSVEAFVKDFSERASAVLTKDELKTIEPILTRLGEMVRLDNISLNTVRDFPARSEMIFKQQARDLAANPDAARLFNAAGEAAGLADDLRRAIDELQSRELLTVADRDRLGDLKVQRNLVSVHASELATMGELRTFGKPFTTGGLLDHSAKMTESQWQAIANNLSYEGDKLIPASGVTQNVQGVPGVVTQFDDIAEALAYKAELMNDPGRTQRLMRRISTFFRLQATASPGFSFRNNYSALHMNVVTAGTTFKDYSEAVDVLRVARQAKFDRKNADEILSQLSPEDRARVDAINEYTDVIGGFQTLLRSAGDLNRSSTRLGDASTPFNRATVLNSSTEGRLLRGRPELAPGEEGFGERLTRNVQAASGFFDRTIAKGTAGIVDAFGAGRRPVRQLENAGNDFSVEELHRFTLMHKLMKDGHSAQAAYRQMYKVHFDYADLTVRDAKLRDSMFPFWTFMSRNLPLQIELLAKRPGAFNNLVAFQEQNNQRYDDSLNPSYFDERLHYVIPEGVWLIGGDQIIPDLQINDVIRRTKELDDIFETGDVAFGFNNLGGIDPQAGLNLILGDSSPMTRSILEIYSQEDTFTGRRLDRFEEPITNTALGELVGLSEGSNNPITHVFGALLSPLGMSRHVPVDPYDPDGEKMWQFTGLGNQAISNYMPLLNRMSRLVPSEDSRGRSRVAASWISFVAGGIRLRNDSDYLITAYELEDDSVELLDELSALAVPSATRSNRGRRSGGRFRL